MGRKILRQFSEVSIFGFEYARLLTPHSMADKVITQHTTDLRGHVTRQLQYQRGFAPRLKIGRKTDACVAHALAPLTRHIQRV